MGEQVEGTLLTRCDAVNTNTGEQCEQTAVVRVHDVTGDFDLDLCQEHYNSLYKGTQAIVTPL